MAYEHQPPFKNMDPKTLPLDKKTDMGKYEILIFE